MKEQRNRRAVTAAAEEEEEERAGWDGIQERRVPRDAAFPARNAPAVEAGLKVVEVDSVSWSVERETGIWLWFQACARRRAWKRRSGAVEQCRLKEAKRSS